MEHRRLFPIPVADEPTRDHAASTPDAAAAVAGGRSYAKAAVEHEQRERERKRTLEQLEELERKELKRQEKKRKRKEERKQKKERKRRKRHIKHHGAPLVRALRDLRPSMAGETIIVVGRVVDESEPTTIPLSEKTLEQHRTGNTAAIREALASHEGEGAEEELSVEAIARRKAKRALEQLQADADAERPSTTVEAEKTKRWEEEERQRRQAECWRTLPYLNKNQDRFRLAKDGRDVILQFDRTQEDTFLPDNTDVWVWGTLEVKIVPLSELCAWRDVAVTIPLDEQIPVFVVHTTKWKLASECTDGS